MDRLSAMTVFRKVVEAEGFAAAGRALGLSTAAVSKQVRALEDHLDTRLLQRTTRQVSLTDAGRAYFERCVTLLDELETLERDTRDRSGEPNGLIRLNAPLDFATCHLSQVLADFLARHPRIDIDLAMSDRMVDPIAAGFDLTVRLSAELEDSSLVMHRLGLDRLHLVAAPAYLDRHGPVERVEDLPAHTLLAYSLPVPVRHWRLRPPDADTPVTIRIAPRLSADNGMLLARAAREGLGIALLPAFLVRPDLDDGQLVRVLDDVDAGTLTIAAMSAPGRRLSPPVRSLIDHISHSLRALR